LVSLEISNKSLRLSFKVLSPLLARVDGGGNTDTLKLAGASLNLDLTQIDNGRIQDIEISGGTSVNINIISNIAKSNPISNITCC
jgi:hypothetical protein